MKLLQDKTNKPGEIKSPGTNKKGGWLLCEKDYLS